MKKLAAVLVLLAGCDLYFGGGDDDPPPPCYDYATGSGAIAPLELRNPYTGECEAFGGPYPCDDRCGPCPAYESQPVPNWGQCYSQCEVLDETSCLGAAGCQAAYETKEGVMPDGTRGYAFLGCWATASGSPIEPVNCSALDAASCSTRDTCSMNYVAAIAPDDGIMRSFSHCSAEGGTGTVCYSDADCTDGERCTAGYEECNPPPGCDDSQGGCPAVCAGHCVPKQTSCSNIDCGPGAHCEEHCSVGPNGETYCEPVCVQDATCAAVDCGPGYHCVETCTDPNPMDPTAPGCGQCYPQCVPDDNPPSCAEIADEMTCYSRSDCQPVYQGEDCTCYPDGCTCNVLTYDRCETRGGIGGGDTPPGM